jgi:DNA-binding NtrC family response regulator
MSEKLLLAGQCARTKERDSTRGAYGQGRTADLLPLRIRTAAEASAGIQNAPIHAGMTLDAVEKEFMLMTLASTQGNKKETAQKLGISRRALYDKLKKHGLL